MEKITRKFILGIGLIIVSSCTQSNKHICPTIKQNNTIIDTCYSSTFNEIDTCYSSTFNEIEFNKDTSIWTPYQWIEVINKDTMYYMKGTSHPYQINNILLWCGDLDCCGGGGSRGC